MKVITLNTVNTIKTKTSENKNEKYVLVTFLIQGNISFIDYHFYDGVREYGWAVKETREEIINKILSSSVLK